MQAHLVTSWEHKNFLGGLRRLALGARTGVVFYPLQLTDWNHDVRPLPDIRTQAELTQPGFLEPRTLGSARLEGNFYRPLAADANADATTQKLYENLEVRGTFGVERPVRNPQSGSASPGARSTSRLWGLGDAAPARVEALLLTYGEARASLDLRYGKDGERGSVDPHKGVYAGAAVQVAGIFPDDGADVRVQPEVRLYAPLSEKLTLGLRLAGGLLFPFNYGGRVPRSGEAVRGRGRAVRASAIEGTCSSCSSAASTRGRELQPRLQIQQE